ncbi:MAG: hypothetical protein P4L53_15950 [Candidatus Obscuribacterales bacterium]|nr:hypothetical protein [Candidatus Obscuribacterales bacterium]
MTTSTKWMELKSSAFALILTYASVLTVNNLALADSEAGLQAGSQASTQNSDQAQHSSTSTATTQNSAEASNEPSTSSVTQNQSQASVEAGRPPNGPANSVQNARQSIAPFAVGQESKNLSRQNDAMPKVTEAPPKSAAPRAANVKAPKSKTVTYHWGRSSKKVATMAHSTP